VGVVGLTTAAVFAAAMSTLSGSLNSSAAATVNDLVLPALGGRLAEGNVVVLTRILTAAFGGIQIAVALGGQHLEMQVIESVLAIAAFTTGIILGVFLLGIGTRSVGAPAALAAMIGGLAAMSCLKAFTPLAWPWYAAFGSMGTFLFGIAIQRLLFGVKSERATA
jgi:Na+/proline symporter